MFGPKPRVEIAQNPYTGYYNQFLEQLKQQASGTGPSLAEGQYKANQGEALQQQMMMSRGRNPGASRQAAYAGGQMQQGLNANATNARLAEQMNNQNMYGNILNSASQNDYQRAMANLQAKLSVMQMPTDWDKLMQAGTALGGAAMAGK